MDLSKRITGPRNRITINMREGFDVRYWASELGISAEQLKEITSRVGERVEDVRKALASRGHNSWQA